ncbi:hypothetical protein J6590_020054 [Homalodisca vitripennis]|nr:hypothetical protein J6590_020054 [Homalodisca vitripennis]
MLILIHSKLPCSERVADIYVCVSPSYVRGKPRSVSSAVDLNRGLLSGTEFESPQFDSPRIPFINSSPKTGANPAFSGLSNVRRTLKTSLRPVSLLCDRHNDTYTVTLRVQQSCT